MSEDPTHSQEDSDSYTELAPELEDDSDSGGDEKEKSGLARLSLFALGIVFGDIGTSPLYAFRESFEHGIDMSESNIYGVLSLITWSLLIVICLKYLVVVMRADHQGEGGILVLTALVSRHLKERWLLLLGLFGTALLYGDGILTPAISVLSAVEGLKVATDVFNPYILPITAAILISLFLFQSRGTGTVGKVFGPIVLCWFLVLGALGAYNIIDNVAILGAFNPYHGLQFFLNNGVTGLWVLGSVFLVVTGGEALYADLGHFGRRPIQLSWFLVVLPGLLLNYFGQGALLLKNPDALENPFYRMVPEWGLYPLVALATAATVIASQALISGAFSLTGQAVQIGYLPRIKVVHTSSEEQGQVYVPAINLLLAAGCLIVVTGFKTSSALAAAYGVAVTVTMVVTTVLLFFLARQAWEWSLKKAVVICGFFLAVDLAFFAGNVNKIPSGGWFPLTVAALVFLLMTTWRAGRSKLANALDALHRNWETFAEECRFEDRDRAEGTAVYLTGSLDRVPISLMASWRHFSTLHENIVLLHVVTEQQPFLRGTKRFEIAENELGFHLITLKFGYREVHDVPKLLTTAEAQLGYSVKDSIYFLGRTQTRLSDDSDWPRWRSALFLFLSRNSANMREFFRLPSAQTVELGLVAELD
ncbi:MAG TPA: potassium transporter Kup [Phycisphaerales bacterium]|nr:potassium transporter Kup [Phycisphaerales bacterium]